jgi:hypothetical protein
LSDKAFLPRGHIQQYGLGVGAVRFEHVVLVGWYSNTSQYPDDRHYYHQLYQ